MQSLLRFITTKPRLVLIIALVLAIPAGWRALQTPINYDLFSYMPEGIESLKGQRILDKQFKTSDTAYLLLSDLPTSQILAIKADLARIPGVSSVTWLSDLVDPTVPSQFVPPEALSLYGQGRHALLHVAFSKPSADPATMDSYKAVQRYLESRRVPPTLTGLPGFIAEMRDLIRAEKNKSIIAAVAFAGLIVALVMRSGVMTMIFLSTIGLGVVFNLGTVRGQLCYLTEALSAVIQLGVTFDFTIFLTQRYREELLRQPDRPQAMQTAMRSTTLAILPSALCTSSGFLALSLMQLKVGADLGLMLAKGVILGVLCAETVMPAALLVFGRFIRPLGSIQEHSSRAAAFIVRHSKALTVIFFLAFIPAIYGESQTAISFNIQDSLPADLPSVKALKTIEKAMGPMELAQVIIPSEVPAFKRQQLAADLGRLKSVSQVYALEKLVDASIPASFVPPEIRSKFERGGYSLMTLKLNSVAGSPEAGHAIEQIRARVRQAAPTALVTGVAAFARDISYISARDIPLVNLASTGLILLIIAIGFRSLSIPVILVGGIHLAICFNLAFAWLFGTTLPFLTVTSIGAIQLGATVDYAILLMARYREERRTNDAQTAMTTALSQSATAIATSGLGLFAATIGVVFVNHIQMIQSMCLLIARGALISTLIILTLLPAVIVTGDKLINKTTWGGGKQPQA